MASFLADGAVLEVVVSKIEARTGGRSATSIAREVRRVATPFARDGWLSPPALGEALRIWLVGVPEAQVKAFCEGMVSSQVNGKLSVGRLVAEIVEAASGRVKTPEGDTSGQASSEAARRELADGLHRLAGANAAAMVIKQCRSLADGARRLPLEQWCVAMRALAIACGAQAPRDTALQLTWRDCGCGDYARFANDLFDERKRDDLVLLPHHNKECSARVAAASSSSGDALAGRPPRPVDNHRRVEPSIALGYGERSALAHDAPSGRLVYTCGGVVIVQQDNDDEGPMRQRILYYGGGGDGGDEQEINSDVHVLCVRPRDGLVATGDARGCVRLWRGVRDELTSSGTTTQQLGTGLFRGAPTAMVFGCGHTLLVAGPGSAAAADSLEERLVALFLCETGELVGDDWSTSRGAVRSAASDGRSTFVTVGDERHAWVWTVDESESMLESSTAVRFGGRSRTVPGLSFAAVAMAPRDDDSAARVAFAGGDDGRISVFRDEVCLAASSPAHAGEVSALATWRAAGDATLAAKAVRLVSGGADAKIKIWSLGTTELSLVAECSRLGAPVVAVVATQPPPAHRTGGSSSCSSAVSLLVGTGRGSILKLRCGLGPNNNKPHHHHHQRGRRGGDGRPDQCRVEKRLGGGHAACARAVAAHPSDPRRFATTGDDRRVLVWTLGAAATLEASKSKQLEAPGTAIAYDERRTHGDSFDGCSVVEFVLVGCADGEVLTLDASTLEVRRRVRVATTAISAIRLTERGLVVGTVAGDIFVLGQGGALVSSKSKATTTKSQQHHKLAGGHTAAIESLDVADSLDNLHDDGRLVLRSQDAAGHVLHWLLDGPASSRLDDIDRSRDATTRRRLSWRTWTASPRRRSDTPSDGRRCVSRARKDTRLFAVADAAGICLVDSPSAPANRPADAASRLHPRGVAKLAFLADDARLVTLGSDDRSVVVWAVLGPCDRDDARMTQHDDPGSATTLDDDTLAESPLEMSRHGSGEASLPSPSAASVATAGTTSTTSLWPLPGRRDTGAVAGRRPTQRPARASSDLAWPF